MHALVTARRGFKIPKINKKQLPTELVRQERLQPSERTDVSQKQF